MRTNDFKATVKAAVLVAGLLLAGTMTAFGQQAVYLTAGPAGITLPDGQGVPMWGYRCGTLPTGVTSSATCAFLNGPTSPAAIGALGAISVVNGGSGYTTAPSVTITPAAGNTPAAAASAVATIANGQVVSIQLTSAGSGYTAAPTLALSAPTSGTTATATAGLAWSPIVITVPTGATGGLAINLTNNLYSTLLTGTGTTAVNPIPTSIMIVGQVGGGLGVVAQRTTASSPDHSNAQGYITWPITGSGPGAPPVQGPRVQSFGTEAAASLVGSTTATPTALTWPLLRPGTYLLESGTHPSIQVPMGLIGMLVVTCSPTAAAGACGTGIANGTAYPAITGTAPAPSYAAVTYNAEIPLEFSEIDPVQNNNVNIAVNTAGFSETMVWSGLGSPVSPGVSQTLGCGNPSSPTYHQCYPPAVNYTPFYYLINGVAFNKTNTALSQFAVSPATGVTAGTGTVLVRLVNAGLRMHVPSIVGSQTTGFTGAGASTTVGGFTLVAEDGNVVPGLLPNTNATGTTQVAAPKVQTDVFMAAGKTFDVMINAPASGPALPVYDRELSLSANSSERDAGMLAYISVNGAGLPTFGSGIAGTAAVVADSYPVVPCPGTATSCVPLVVSDVSRGVMANDSYVYGVQLAVGPLYGALTCGATPGNPVPGLCTNGTFTYTPIIGGTLPDSFQYCANGSTTLCTTVTLNAGTLEASTGILMSGITYTAKTSSYISIPPPGPLAVDKDNAGYPLSVVTSPPPTLAGGTLTIQPNGGFIATLTNPCTSATGCSASFSYNAQNSQGTVSSPATVTINFPAAYAPSAVTVVDGVAYKNAGCNAGNAVVSTTGVTCNGKAVAAITDYRWIIEEDKTFYVNPVCTTISSTPIVGCPQPTATTVPPTFGVNFHTSHMDYVAQGCTDASSTGLSCEQGQTVLGVPSVCQVGNGLCVPGTAQPAVQPTDAILDPGCGFGTTTFPASLRTCGVGVTAPYPKRYYISILPGDAANSFENAGNCLANPTPSCGHGMGGASISWNTTTNSWNPVVVLTEPNPFPPAKLSVQVFEGDFPLNGEQDAGGGIDVIATNEPGLGGFEIIMWDDMGQSGDVTGQMTHDMFNQPLSNSLAGTIDPATGHDACPISPEITKNTLANGNGPTSLTGISGRIVTCPKYESDGVTLSPLAGQATVANLMPGRYSVQAYPGADRIARGEEWLQTNTLDGQHPHDSFLKINEPSYFQEYGPAGFHVSIGFANPKIINARWKGVCGGTDLNLTAANCTNTVTGRVTMERMSRPPDERLYSSGSRDAFSFTQCWVSLGDPDGEDFMFTKCDANGNFTFRNVPSGGWRLTIGDQWNDQLIDGLSTPINVANGNNQTVTMNDVPAQQWQSNLYTRTFIDDNKDGVYQSGEAGIPFADITVRLRDGMMANSSVTDLTGFNPFNETFPLFSWYVVESDNTRYKSTGTHTVYDVGGPANGSTSCGGSFPSCGPSGTGYDFLANTYENYPLPSNLSVPGAIYCSTPDCTGATIFSGTPVPSSTSNHSSSRIDPPWVFAEGWQGFSGQGNFVEFGKTPYAACPPACATVPATIGGGTNAQQVGENGGISGHVVYASTRPFDDPQMLVQTQCEPLVPHVTMNLYQEGFAADGVTPTLKLVDTTQTSSWDDWAQGFRTDGMPNMNCPGQAPAPTTGTAGDLFFYTLLNQPNYLDLYSYYYNGTALHNPATYSNSQYKCYDAMHNWDQLQPAAYDGVYKFPSVLGIIPSGANAGKLNTALTGGVGAPGTTSFTAGNMPGTNCTICIPNPDATDAWRHNTPMLPPGKYVVEVVLPPGYELVKEEDKNILIGDNFIAPVTQQFGGLANIFILPDQASAASMYDPSASGFNANNTQNATQSLGMAPRTEEVPGFLFEPVWPCVGANHIVPDYMSIFPAAHEVAAFAGATRRLCDRKEVTLASQMSARAKFYIYTSTHIAGKYTGLITDDFTSEFDPFAPVFGEKFSPPNLPVASRDWVGNEISRVYTDQWGAFNGLTYSTWEVNPPNPTGYAPTMMVQCMNDKGPAIDFRPTIVDSTGATVTNPNYGKLADTDPLFNPAYSDFCYELPYMPGTTSYLDTPVVPTEAMVGAGYNNADCAYPTLTPAIAEVDGDGVGPWVSAEGHTITITALGDQIVDNYGYSGPQATTSPWNQKQITRHYGFGASQGTGSVVLVGSDGVKHPLGGVGWSDLTITGTVPSGLPNCPVQQQTQYGGSAAQCGELVITAGNGRQSVDTVTVTVGGKAPTHVSANQTI